MIDLPSRQINDFFYKKETEKIELVARPDSSRAKVADSRWTLLAGKPLLAKVSAILVMVRLLPVPEPPTSARTFTRLLLDRDEGAEKKSSMFPTSVSTAKL